MLGSQRRKEAEDVPRRWNTREGEGNRTLRREPAGRDMKAAAARGSVGTGRIAAVLSHHTETSRSGFQCDTAALRKSVRFTSARHFGDLLLNPSNGPVGKAGIPRFSIQETKHRPADRTAGPGDVHSPIPLTLQMQ